MYHTDLSRDHGLSGGIDLSRINWGNYDLVVIDESHNFKNGGKTTINEDGTESLNRYNKLMERVIKSGVKTKVLMLSATPVNNRFVDLKYQLELAYEGAEDEINDKLNTKKGLSTIFNNAQRAFNDWSKLPEEERTTEALLKSLDQDFFEVLDSVTIARSRKHIEKSYNMAEIGKFPKRLDPDNRYPAITLDDSLGLNYDDIFSKLEHLFLSVYSPSKFIFPSKLEKYEQKYGKKAGKGISLTGREMGTRKLMATNLLKRLESSWYSFNETAKSIFGKINGAISAIEQFKTTKASTGFKSDIFDIDGDDDDIDSTFGDYNIDFNDMDYESWLAELKNDQAIFGEILRLFGQMNPELDNKLNELKSLIRDKLNHPLNGGNKKVLIFTAWADTAQYLYDNLSRYMLDEFGLHTGVVTGNASTSDSTLKRNGNNGKFDFNELLTMFSPVSKGRDQLNNMPSGDIDILIGTDCISEGQNLQDCDYMVNFDIHWNPVRIVQRFGRIDRIGSRNEKIQMVNFWPEEQLDKYIDLNDRVQNRMVGLALASTGTNVIGKDQDLPYRRAQLERIRTETPDLEDMDTGVNIMDLGLNEFRLEVVDYRKTNPGIETAAHGLHAVVAATPDMPAGTIFVLRNVNNGDRIDKQNRLHPFYMVYLGEDGDVVCDHLSAKHLLDMMGRLCKGKTSPDKHLCKLFNTETKDGFDMSHYSEMLNRAIQTIINVKEETDVNSIFSYGGSTLGMNEMRGLDDFELICFVVVK